MSIDDVRPSLKFKVNFEDDPLQAHPAYLLSTDPIRFWRMEALTGATETDQMGIQDLGYGNSPTLGVTGPFNADYEDLNPAVSFNGSDEFAQTGVDSFWQNFTGPWTLSAWVYPTATRSGSSVAAAGIISTYRPGAATQFMLWYGRVDAWGFTNDRVFGGWSNAGDQRAIAIDTVNLTQNAWTHYAVTWDLTTVTLYRNGVAVATNTPAFATSAGGTTQPLTVAYAPFGDTPFFPGRIDEVGVWDRALRADEVLNLVSYHTIRTVDEDNYIDLSASLDLSSSRVRSSPVRRGRSDSVSRVEAGTGTIILGNRDGKLSPDPVVNLLANPSYEIEEVGLPFTVYRGGTLTQDIGDATGTGQYHWLFTGVTTDSFGQLVTRRDGLVGMRPGKTYTFSAYVYVTSGLGITLDDVGISIHDSIAGSEASTSSANPSGFDAWERLTVTRTIRDAADEAWVAVTFVHEANAGRYLRVDAVQLEEANAATAYTDGDGANCSWGGEPHRSLSHRRTSTGDEIANYIVNGEFEDNITGWTYYAGGATASFFQAYDGAGFARRGSYGLWMNVIPTIAGGLYYHQINGAGTSDSVRAAVAPGDTVCVYGSWQAASGNTRTPASVDLIVTFWDSGGGFLSNDSVEQVVSPSLNTWYDLSGSATAPASAAYATLTALSIWNLGDGLTVSCGIDSAQLTVNYDPGAYIHGQVDPGGMDYLWQGAANNSRLLAGATPRNSGMPMRRFRLTATWDAVEYGLLHGYVERWDYQFPGYGKDATVTARLTDGTRILAARSMRGFVRSSERVGDRVRAILAHAGIAEADYDVDDNYIDVIAVAGQAAVTDDRSALSMIRDLEETERGVFFVSKDGLFTYQGVLYRSIEGVEDIVLTDDDTEVTYSDISISSDVATVVNDSNIENVANASDFRYVDTLSQQRFFPVSASESSLWATNVVSPVDRSEALRIAEGVEVRPYRDPDTLWPQVLGLELGALARIERTHQGVDLSHGYLHFVEGIEHDIQPGNWITRLRTAPTPQAPTTADPWQTTIAKPILVTSIFSGAGGSSIVIPSASYTAGRLYVAFMNLWSSGGTVPAQPTFGGSNTWTSIIAQTGVSSVSVRHQAFYSVASATATETVTLSFGGQTPDNLYDVVVVEIRDGFDATPIADSAAGTTISAYAGYVDVGTLTNAQSIILASTFKNANADTNWSGGVELYDRHASDNIAYSVAYGFPPGDDRIDFSWGQANGWNALGFEVEAG